MALQNRPTQVRANPAGLNEHLVKDAAPVEPIAFAERIDSELAALNTAVDEYSNDNGKVEQTLADAKREVARLMAELNASQQKLQTLEAQGSALDRYNASVGKAEGQFKKIVELYTARVHADIVRGWFGQDIDLHAISKDRKADLKLHKRVTDLRKFTYVTPPGVDPRFKTAPNVANLNLRVDAIETKLVELKEHVEKDSAKN